MRGKGRGGKERKGKERKRKGKEKGSRYSDIRGKTRTRGDSNN